MDDLKTELGNALKAAMRNKDVRRRDTLRFLLSAVKQVEVDSRKELSSAEVEEVLQKEVKRHRESIEEFQKGHRADLVQKEQEELVIIQEFLPQPLSTEEITAIIKQVIAETGATSVRDVGKVMRPVMERVKDRADGIVINQIVREQLNS